jgi:ABC-type bacteriocin/lantibiotic exporter with double-glycine peptidase domain
MQQLSHHRMGKDSPTYLDPQILMITNLLAVSSRKDVVAYFVKAMRHNSDKEILVILFNKGNHWVTLAISTKYDHVWYCDSARPIYSITSERLTRDWTDIMAILEE